MGDVERVRYIERVGAIDVGEGVEVGWEGAEYVCVLV